jgi:uncharacterized membrane-anchored protein YhcB (DUF1043 family)
MNCRFELALSVCQKERKDEYTHFSDHAESLLTEGEYEANLTVERTDKQNSRQQRNIETSSRPLKSTLY